MKRLGLLARALVVYGIAVALRMRNIRGVFVGDLVLFGFDDPYYHLRRVLLILKQFPKLPVFDSYLNFPGGAAIQWPPGFDLFVAAVAWIAGLGDPSRHRIEATAAILIPFLGAATAVVVLLLGEEIFGRGRWEAFVAAILFAFLPAQQAISTVGRLDHHVVEMIAFGSAILFFLRAIRDDPGSRYSFWGGLALAAGVFCWSGAVIYAGWITFFALGQLVLDRIGGRGDEGLGRSALRVLFWGGLLLVPLVLLIPGEGRTSLTYLLFSWYQPALLGIGALLVAFVAGALFAPSDARGRRRAIRGFAASGIVAAAGAALLLRGAGGIGFLTRHDPVIALLVESTPAWKLPPGQIVEYFSHLIYLAPIAAIALARRAVKARFADTRFNALLVLFVFTAILGALQARFLNYFAVPFVLAVMWGFRALTDSTRRRFATKRMRWAATGSLATLLILAPIAPTLRDSMHSLPGNVQPALAHLYSSLEWMRDRTPPTSHLLDPDRRPEYGVLADFTFGHWISTIAERPNFCNPFSLAPWHEKPIFESARLFLAEEELPVVEALDRNRLRYVLLYNNENAVPDYARLAGVDVADYLEISPDGRNATPTPRFFRTFGVRLALADGVEYRAAGALVPTLAGFRLVHESPETRRRVVPGLPSPIEASWVKIFERVRGVGVEGTADPGSEVSVRIAVTTDAGRGFEYHARTAAGEKGDFTITVPYASIGGAGVVAGPAHIETSRCSGEIRVTEEEVLGGARRVFRCPA